MPSPCSAQAYLVSTDEVVITGRDGIAKKLSAVRPSAPQRSKVTPRDSSWMGGSMMSCCLSSDGCCGRPRRARYSGEAHMITSVRASLRAMKSPCSGLRVEMTVMSKLSSSVSTGPGATSSTLTSGYIAWKRAMWRASWWIAIAGGISTRRLPRGSLVAAEASASASSMSLRMRRQRSR